MTHLMHWSVLIEFDLVAVICAGGRLSGGWCLTRRICTLINVSLKDAEYVL